MKIVKDWIDANTFHVLNGTSALGHLEQFAPNEWKAFDASGSFVGWFTSKRKAANAL